MTTTWASSTLWWQLYPLGFTGAPIRPAGAEPIDGSGPARLTRIEGWLDHLLELGLNGLALGPVFASSTHGYDTVDHFRIDPRLGTEEHFDHLVSACRRRGIRVLLDGVFNHVGRAHPLFAAALRDGPGSAAGQMFHLGRVDGRTVAEVFEGHEGLPSLNHRNPAVVDLTVDAMRYWLDRGADGWRLDAAYAVPPSFWADVLPRVRAQHPDAWFMGEVIHGDAAAIVAESGVDSLTQYELWQGIWHSIADRNLFELAHAIKRNNRLLSAFVPATFIGNHDVNRIASAVGHEFAEHAVALLMTVAGCPFVYAGDEYGQTGTKGQGWDADDPIRPEFPAVPPARDTLDPSARRMLGTHEHLISLRRKHPWLTTAHTDVLAVTNTAIVLPTAVGTSAIVTALNLADDTAALTSASSRTLLAGNAELTSGALILPARAYAVLSGD